jgi:homoserine kinase type II
MAVYTQVSDEALSRFLASYDVGRLTSFKGIAGGVENTNYSVHTDRGAYFLTLYEKRVARADLPFFLGLMEHAARNGINCPVPVHDRQGRVLRELAHRPAALVTFLEGISVNKPGVRQCASLGEALARFHRAGEGFGLKRANALSVTGWRPLFESFQAHADDIARGLAKEIEGELTLMERQWPKDLPQGVIHADLFPDNVFFLDQNVSGLIDFYFACNDALAYDVAICLNAWCFEADSSYNMTKGRALLRGYTKVRKMQDNEIAALPLLARGSALRFFLTRAFDWLNTPKEALVRPKDPLEYLRKLRFHRDVTDVSAYGLAGDAR